jgi:hypothetical protein
VVVDVEAAARQLSLVRWPVGHSPGPLGTAIGRLDDVDLWCEPASDL